MEWLAVALVAALPSATVGAVLAHWRERDAVKAAWLGGLLGPIGWLVEVLGRDRRPVCRQCGGRMVPGASRCRYCGDVLGIPFPARRAQ